jgi:hypothetical protein
VLQLLEAQETVCDTALAMRSLFFREGEAVDGFAFQGFVGPRK